jgi:DNA replication protein DnaC
MIPLEQKLLDLNLTVMSHRLETTLSEAAGKNLSAAATLEWLADMELEARHGRAIERRFKCSKLQAVLFTTAMDMLNHLLASQVDHSLVRKLKAYTEPGLLICDELGYLALDQQSSNLFYQVISTRHSQKRSTIITTNTAFSDWGNILFNTTIATAIADRLVENSEIFMFGGDSLRKPKNPNPPAE